MENLKYVTKGFLLHFHIELTTQPLQFSLDRSIEEWCIYWSLGMIFFPRDFVVCFLLLLRFTPYIDNLNCSCSYVVILNIIRNRRQM